jgi:hypothetical protein
MSESPDQFRRAPKRKPARAKHVTMSPEAKRAYEELMKERDEREKTYTRHLPPDSTRR